MKTLSPKTLISPDQRVTPVESTRGSDVLVMVKVAERCNIDCRYCYMYHGVDQSWRERPRFLSPEHRIALAERIKAHKRAHPEARMTVEIHGGEPLLLGRAAMRDFFVSLREELSPDELLIVAQTNGILLDNDWLDMFAATGATLAISCDGPPSVHDRHRVGPRGEPTGVRVEQAILRCLAHPASAQVFNGILAVAEPNCSGGEVVRYFHKLGVPSMDLLLPDANWARPPAHLPGYHHKDMIRFLHEAFSTWMELDDPSFRVRLFEVFIKSLLGQRPELDALGGDVGSIVVVESDGSYRLLDVLTICERDVAGTGLHVTNASLDAFLTRARSAYPAACRGCQACPAYTSCGGGYIAHRFDGNGYDRPSFYCEVLYDLHYHIRDYVARRSHYVGTGS